MWQSSMLISLLVLSLKQIIVPIWVKHGYLHRGPITLLEPLVVLIGRHKDILVKRLKLECVCCCKGRRIERIMDELG